MGAMARLRSARDRGGGRAGVCMFLTQREFGLAVLLVVLGILALWLQWANDDNQTQGFDGERRPDYIVEGLKAVTLDAEGAPARRLDAVRLRHYPDDGSSELDEPLLQLFDDAVLRWNLRSRRAWINARGDEVLLEQEVRLERTATAESALIELRTSELLLLPESDYAETTHAVEVERAHDRLSAAQGLQAWLGDDARIRLFGPVRARMEGARRGPGSDDDGG